MALLPSSAIVSPAIAAKITAAPIAIQDLRLALTVVPIIDADCIVPSTDVQHSCNSPAPSGSQERLASLSGAANPDFTWRSGFLISAETCEPCDASVGRLYLT